jgi:phenylpyruvate tautomerase PptA (4-oxalocrotonate tautomerase family)
MFIPLYTVAQTLKGLEGVKLPIPYNDLIKILDNKIRELEKQRKQEERESLEADIIQAISDLSAKAMNESLDERTCIHVKEISEHLGWNGEKGDPRSPIRVGFKLKAMGINVERTKAGKVIQHLQEPTKLRLIELKKRFLEPLEKETPKKGVEVKG